MAKAAEAEKREADALAHEAIAMAEHQVHDIKEANAVSFRALMMLYGEQMVQREVTSKCVPSGEQSRARQVSPSSQ